MGMGIGVSKPAPALKADLKERQDGGTTNPERTGIGTGIGMGIRDGKPARHLEQTKKNRTGGPPTQSARALA